MIPSLDRKLIRDLGRMKGQVVAVALVMACGLAMMIMTRGLIHTLENARDSYYQRYGMADVFASLKRAPLAAADPVALLPGVSAVEPRVVVDVTLDMPGRDEPATGRVVSLPDDRPAVLNQLFLRRGRLPGRDERRGVVCGEAFANANHLNPGDSVIAIINGRREVLQITGIGLSPEFVFEARPGETLPDNRRFGVFWMNYRAVAMAYNLDGAFNDLCLDLAPGAAAEPVLTALDRMLAPFGATGAYTREDQASSTRLDDELRVLHALALVYPIVFLSVAAFMTNAVLARLVRLQREQIAQLKALGYSSRQVALHYMKFALVIVVAGTAIGCVAGNWMGRHLVVMYTKFFRFPVLEFAMDPSALGWGLLISSGAAMLGVLGVVRMAAALPPAEAMRPEPPADFHPSWAEKLGLTHGMSPSFRMALRNIERKPVQAAFTSAGLALATGLMVLPGAMSDSINYLLSFQWNLAQRQDAVVMLTEPGQASAFHDLRNLPGVIAAEPLRSVAARLRFGHRHRKLAITGLPAEANLNRLLDEHNQPIVLPPEGVVMSRKLAEVLGAGIGDTIAVEVLEGRRPVREAVISGLVTDYAGVAAYMDIAALRRLLREGDNISGAYLKVDTTRWAEFMRATKDAPRTAVVLAKKDQLASFRDTIGSSIGILRKLYFTLAVIVAFGVVYNSARIALAERTRELATLRVVGFTRGEVIGVLLGELAILTAVALPLGLWLGRTLTVYIIGSFSTETVRMPLWIEPASYAVAAAVVLSAAALSFAVVSRMVAKLDLVGVLKARD